MRIITDDDQKLNINTMRRAFLKIIPAVFASAYIARLNAASTVGKIDLTSSTVRITADSTTVPSDSVAITTDRG
jgi:hypothetical protein